MKLTISNHETIKTLTIALSLSFANHISNHKNMPISILVIKMNVFICNNHLRKIII